jgi:hypothetical protein
MSLAIGVACLALAADVSAAEASSASEIKTQVDNAAKEANVVGQLMRVENQVLHNDAQAAVRDAPVVIKAEQVSVKITSLTSVIVANAALLDGAKSLAGPGGLKLAEAKALRVESAVANMSKDLVLLKRDDAKLRSSVWSALSLDVTRASSTVVKTIQATIKRPSVNR